MINERYWLRYIKFLSVIPIRNYVQKSGLERHHVLPSALFPEYKHNIDNIIVLTSREHYIAHWMLAKIYGGKMWFAFNQMRRILPTLKSSRLFEAAKNEINSIISITNSSKVRSEEFRHKCSERYKGTVIARQINSTKWERIKCSDERLTTGEYIPFGTGKKHSIHTKTLISNNGIQGKVAYNNGTRVIYLSPDEAVPDGFVMGQIDSFGESISSRMKTIVTYYDPETNRHYRKSKEFTPPNHWIKGRKFGTENGLSKMNNGQKQVFNIKTKKFEKCNLLYENPFHIFVPGNGIVVKWHNFIFESVSFFNELNTDIPKLNKSTFSKTIRLHPNYSINKQKFTVYFDNSTYEELKFELIVVREYNIDIDDTFILIRRDDECRNKNNDFRRAFAAKTGFRI